MSILELRPALVGKRMPVVAVSGSTPNRERSVDLVRAICLVVVVVLHGTMAGVTIGQGGLEITNVMEGQVWFAPASWVLQIMPLFFLVGGFSSLTQWRRMQLRGEPASEYVRGRVVRLLRPALILFSVVAGACAAAILLGADEALVAAAAYRIGQPLWFLAVYLGTACLVPVMSRLHDRAKGLTLAGLLATVVAVDIVRLVTGLEAFGFLNLAFVWLFLQQLGFFSGYGASVRRAAPAVVVTGLAALVLLTTVGPYSPDMLVNLNPPTACLVILGIVQAAILVMLRPRLNRMMRSNALGKAVDAIGNRSMTIYLWHLPVMVTVVLCMLFLGVPFAEPLSLEWWVTRTYWLGTVALALAPVAWALGRLERGRLAPIAPLSGARAAAAALSGIVGVGLLLTLGFAVPASAIGALVLVVLALYLVRGLPRTGALSRVRPNRRSSRREATM
ncbi:acyltransferase family protein [Glaciibacter superstes]|uniref:acyltransferase family protein n=1 Tax=Glaciibacter superstes TaxID=501023 RepID=UPI0012FCC29C|nr:acyltransferase [Glaciibacter superstes]